ncbi:enoyl-CoA hydratase/isomerase family protein, partial [Pseudomonas protegens]
MSCETALPIVESALHGNILVLTLNNPPVNALGVEIRRGLLAAIDSANDNPAVEAILLVGAGRHFCGGADIREFGQTPQAPALPEVVKRIEDSSKPVLAAIQGVALGGGLEVALAAHYRLATGSARLGLPEVLLGLLPGAGGTQRLPRLIGAKAALELMLSGRHLSAKEALDLGLVDRLGDSDDALAEGLAYMRQLLAQGATVRRTRDAQALSEPAA